MDDPISAERLSHLIGLIYDCAIDPAGWPIAMEAMRTELDFHNATLDLILLPSGTALSSVMCNIPSQYAALTPDAGPDVIEQWGGEEIVRSLPMDRPAVLTRANPTFDMSTTTNGYCVAFAKPQGLIDVMAIGLARDARAIGTVSFGRHMSAGPITEREVAIAQLLVPHLQRAATINRMLEGAVLAQSNFVATLDTLAAPVILVDANREVVHANPAATRLLDQKELVRIEDGQLQSVSPGASSALATAIVQASRDESAIGRKGLGIPVSAPDGSHGALHILPLSHSRRGNGRGAVAAVFVAYAHAPFVAPTELVAALFSLTPAEARVFELISGSYSLAEAASALGVERSTVKTHLLRIYGKVGVKRQAALVKIAISLASPSSSSG